MRTSFAGLTLVLGLLVVADASHAEAVPPGYRLVAAEQNIPPALFYAVALTESGKWIDRVSSLRPWPWTLNIAGEGRFFPTRKAAFDALSAAIDSGERSIDIGLMQVSWRYHHEKLRSLSAALDPYHNLRVGARILRACYGSMETWWDAVGCYHAPSNVARRVDYIRRVRVLWQGARGED